MTGMFSRMSKVASLNIEGWKTDTVTTMAYTFNGCSALTSLDIGIWDTSKVTDMKGLFQNCQNLTSLDIGNWNTSKVTDMSYLLNECAYLKTVNLATHVVNQGLPSQYIAWDTSNVSNMSFTLAGLRRIESINVSNWNTSNVKDMSYLFRYFGYNNSSSTPLDVSSKQANVNGKIYTAWDTGAVTNMAGSFMGSLRSASIDVSNWNTSNVTNMSEMFSNCSTLQSLDVNTKKVTVNGKTYTAWNMSNVTDISKMFSYCQKLATVSLSNWDTSSVKNMSYLFQYGYVLTAADVGTKQVTVNGVTYHAWDTSNVTTMSGTFSSCRSLASLDLSKWNTSKVTNMLSMVNGCKMITSFSLPTQQVTVGGKTYTAWDVSSVRSFGSMFGQCTNLKTLNLSGWNTSSASTYDFGSFAHSNPNLTSITLGPNFGQSTNAATSDDIFKVYSPHSATNLLKTTVYGANAVMRAYDWASDFRNVTFVNPTASSTLTLDFEEGSGTIKGYEKSN